MKNMLKLGFILAAYATVACVGLAFVYAGTKVVIAERQLADQEAALKELFPAADSFEEIDIGQITSPDAQVAFRSAYAVAAGGKPVGLAITAAGPSYGGPTTVLVGVGAGNTISGVKILENKDTPGLGANAASTGFYVDAARKITFCGQFAGKRLRDAFRVKEDIAAITASTITSKAITNIVKAAGGAAGAWLTADPARGGN